MSAPILLVHGSAATLAEIRAYLTAHLEVDAVCSAQEARRRLHEGDYAVVVLDGQHPDLEGGRLLAELAAAAPDALLVLLNVQEEAAMALEDLAPGRIFRFLGGSGQWWQLPGTVREALRLWRLEREQQDLVRRLHSEHIKLQRREKLLDVVVRERTRELELAYERLQAAARQAILGLAEAIEAKDAYTKGHCGRVAVYALTLGREAGLSGSELQLVEFGAFLHDIGKIGIRDQVLLKPGPLDAEEWAHMRQHPLVGSQIASQLEMLKPLVPCVRNHHERWDGTGYPDGLRGEDIPLAARIVCLADAYDAMATDRPYQRALSPQACEQALRRQAGLQFDPALVDLFLTRGLGTSGQ
ncbi:MAG: HD domain-containing protein [Myxococcales bacterium]|nr:HD domain-containing protein [Myxococcota bacterium]MDW8283145.1 HD domain-containing protein [Myxococcales bacterium]